MNLQIILKYTLNALTDEYCLMKFCKNMRLDMTLIIIPDLYVYPVGYADVTVLLCSMSICLYCLCHVGGHWKTVGQCHF